MDLFLNEDDRDTRVIKQLLMNGDFEKIKNWSGWISMRLMTPDKFIFKCGQYIKINKFSYKSHFIVSAPNKSSGYIDLKMMGHELI